MTNVLLIIANIAFGVWLVGSGDPSFSKWIGAVNFFCAGLLTANVADDFIVMRALRHG